MINDETRKEETGTRETANTRKGKGEGEKMGNKHDKNNTISERLIFQRKLH